jgi:hypothetical protein
MESYFPFSGEPYLYFPEGVRFYRLYRTSRKINSFAELEYVAEKFIHLNPDYELEHMKRLFVQLSERSSGHTIRTYGQDRVEAMVESVCKKRKVPYCPKLRKVVFNPSKRMSKSEKMKIVGQLIGTKPRLSEKDLIAVIEDMAENKIKITVSKIAELTDKTKHLVNQSLTEKTKNLIKVLNEKIKHEVETDRVLDAVDKLCQENKKITVRRVKEICSVRNYKLIKKAMAMHLDDC